MKMRIKLILLSMALCTMGLLSLQVYWNYQAYQRASASFRSDINDALETAVSKELGDRRDGIAEQYKSWLADTNLVNVRCYIHPTYQTTVFAVADKNPPYSDQVEFTIVFEDFKERLSKITPEAKTYFIERFVNTQVKDNLVTGTSYYYTQRLGQLLNEAFAKSKLNLAQLETYYRAELTERGISTPFELQVLQPNDKHTFNQADATAYTTRTLESGFTSATEKVVAFFPDPHAELLQRMKWVLLASFLLIGLTIFCFAYTVRTILRQKKLSELKNDFVNNMTHELRTPVATISIAAEAIQEFNLSKASSQEYLSIIRQQSGRLSHLIDSILKNLAFEQDQLELNVRPLPLQQLAQQAVLQHKPQLNLAGASVSYTLAEAPVYVQADELHLLNVLSNLIENALKYSHGTLHLELRCYQQNGQAILELKDNGMGIPAAMQSKVFDQFFRVPTGNTHNTKGYGLGLSYAKTIVERHGGNITLQSREQQGTTFILSLPLYQYEPAQSPVA